MGSHVEHPIIKNCVARQHIHYVLKIVMTTILAARREPTLSHVTGQRNHDSLLSLESASRKPVLQFNSLCTSTVEPSMFYLSPIILSRDDGCRLNVNT